MPHNLAFTAEALKVFETVPDPYLILSPELHVLTASDAYLAATFSVRQKIIGKPLGEIFPNNPAFSLGESLTDLQASLNQVLATGKPQQLDLQPFYGSASLSKNEAVRKKHWRLLNTPVLDKQGEILYIILKLSEQKAPDVNPQPKQELPVQDLPVQPLHENGKQEANAKLRAGQKVESEQAIETGQAIKPGQKVEASQNNGEGDRQLRMITDALPVLISYVDKDRVYQFANKAYENWFPFKSEELPGRPVWEVIGEKAYQLMEKHVDGALAGERQDFEATIPSRTNSYRHIKSIFIPDIREGEVTGFYALVTDISEQKQTISRLAESEEKYRNLFEVMDQGFCIMEIIFDEKLKPVDYRFLETNPVFEQQTGLKDAKGKTARELVPNLETHWVEIYGNVALTGKTAHMTQGSEAMGRWFEINAFRLGGPGSSRVALLFTNITERKQAEERLKRINLWFKRVNQATQDAIWDWDLELEEVTWNEGVQRMFNYKPSEVDPVPHWWYTHIHSEDRKRVIEGIHQVIDSRKEHWSAEYRFLTGDGTYKIVFDRGFVTHDETGKPVRMIGAMQDITERKAAEQALKKSEERFSRVIEGSNDGIWEWNLNDDSAWWNQRFGEILGMEIPENERGLKRFSESVHPEDRHLFAEALKAHLERGEKYEVAFRIIRPSGEIRYVLSKGKAIADEQGQINRLSGTLTDYTDRKLTDDRLKVKNDELMRINNDLDNFIYTASHDLKAPILNIEGLINLLNQSLSAESLRNRVRAMSIMDMIHTSIDKFKETIKDLAEVAKVESNAQEEVADIPFEALLDEVKLNIQSLIDESGAIIQADFSQVPSIQYSKKNLRSIIYNLLSNAIKYRSPARPALIQISSSRPDQAHILLSVQDNGVGIKEKDKTKVFMMFKRLNQHVEGTGIGMAIVKKIIDNSGGKIELESQVGKGSVFKIYFKV